MSFIRNLNRKQRRKFDKLEQEEKKQILAHEISQKVNEAAGKKISNAFVQGAVFANKILYEHYLEGIENLSEEEKTKRINDLVEEITRLHEKAVKMFPEDSKQEGEEK